MTPTDMQCLTVLQAAASAAVGLCVRTNNAYKARAELYRFRKDFGDPELRALSIRVSPNDSERELWILRASATNATTVNLATDTNLV
jgi:hypothetical protein